VEYRGHASSAWNPETSFIVGVRSFSRLVDRTGNFLAIGDIRVSSLLDIHCDITTNSPACGISRN
jgi:hypothetical protein